MPHTKPSPAARVRLARRAVPFLLLPLLAACVGEQREQELGDELAQQINSQAPLIRDPVLNSYVDRLGRRLAAVSERPKVPYRFYLVNTPEVNAFALPGGHIYVTRGLVERTESLSQLGAVLAHEVGHVAARHGAEQLERQLRTGSLVSVLYQVILGDRPALLERQALRLGSELWFARHSREDEREADRLAVGYLIDAGVEPQGMVSFLEELREDESGRRGFAAEWFSTHPITSERVELLRREIDAISQTLPDDLVRDVSSYPAFQRRLRSVPTQRAR